ncbi:conserved hypothetical protein [Perkinsus marinus ATCC 50983]|uniref:S1/P1nuclease n=1 Tax=Perkinsus marinus (strain ATCC 50983 / TXsc) TaxID=423536 RepID=C5LTF5_PERM5|nr:conserved hypothetical protein [Perkinsus marinus ATCC 50983]EER00123.1 conserved hypothetical protein [Perkinsus marinus ATCC 50983]|eukprot:XP_002767405.1 conserved hypothetical protein [Perkinsus marinus ATCC 50983]
MWHIVFILLPSITLGWDKELHARIGDAVGRVLSHRDMEDIDVFLEGRSLSWMSRYAHDNLQYTKYDRTVENHYETQSRNWQCDFDVEHPERLANKEGLYETVTDIFGRLCHERDNNKGIAADKTEQVQLSWLMGLIQDMHQPLHLGFGADDHGRRITVEYHGSSYNLYDFWEKQVSPSVNLDTELIHKRYLDELKSLNHYGQPRNMKLVQELHKGGLAMWVAENMKTACYEIYAAVAGGGGREVPRSFVVSDRIFEEWRSLASTQAIKAAARTAVVLHAVAIHMRTYHPEQTSLYKRSSSVKHRIRDNWHEALLKNLGLAIIIVPLLIISLNPGEMSWLKDLLKKGGSNRRID